MQSKEKMDRLLLISLESRPLESCSLELGSLEMMASLRLKMLLSMPTKEMAETLSSQLFAQ